MKSLLPSLGPVSLYSLILHENLDTNILQLTFYSILRRALGTEWQEGGVWELFGKQSRRVDESESSSQQVFLII